MAVGVVVGGCQGLGCPVRVRPGVGFARRHGDGGVRWIIYRQITHNNAVAPVGRGQGVGVETRCSVAVTVDHIALALANGNLHRVSVNNRHQHRILRLTTRLLRQRDKNNVVQSEIVALLTGVMVHNLDGGGSAVSAVPVILKFLPLVRCGRSLKNRPKLYSVHFELQLRFGLVRETQ